MSLSNPTIPSIQPSFSVRVLSDKHASELVPSRISLRATRIYPSTVSYLVLLALDLNSHEEVHTPLVLHAATTGHRKGKSGKATLRKEGKRTQW